MKAHSFSLLLCCLALSPACRDQSADEKQPVGSESTVRNQFDGAWQFVHLVTPDGLSTNQRGHMVVSSNCVCFVRVEKERESIDADESDEVKQRQAAALYNSVKATCGTFSIEGDSLTAQWLTSADPGIEGNSTRFILTTENDTVSLAPAVAPQYKFVYRRLR